LSNLFIKIIIGKIFCFFFIVFRGSFPRWRIDFLVRLGWKIILPLGFLYLYILLGL
jgi:NADH-quinone oxidoreductase subunit H